MKAALNRKNETTAELEISAGESVLQEIKQLTLKRLQPEVSAPGFRKGKVPLNLVEKQVDANYLQSQFLDDAMTELYQRALAEHKLRPVDRPKVEIKKFAAFTEIAFDVTVEVLPEIKLPDYKKITVTRPKVSVAKKDIDEVIENLRKRVAEKKTVKRAAKDGDEVMIDFDGVDKDKKPVAGASGKDYPLALGSDTFIPGFEKELVGLKADDTKSFPLTFPEDYGHKPLAGAKVTFNVTLKEVKEVVLPKIDDAFANTVGPFKNIEELQTDVKKQLTDQKNQEADAKVRDDIIEQLAKKSTLTPPETLVEENIESLMNEFKQNLLYRGISVSEFMEQSKTTEEDYRKDVVRPQAEQRVVVGLMLSEISEVEGIQLTNEEIDMRLTLLKGQYGSDDAMSSQLDTDEARREIAARMVTEKTIEKLVSYATVK